MTGARLLRRKGRNSCKGVEFNQRDRLPIAPVGEPECQLSPNDGGPTEPGSVSGDSQRP